MAKHACYNCKAILSVPLPDRKTVPLASSKKQAVRIICGQCGKENIIMVSR
jgi:RNase P subunit RPR2